MTVQEAVHMVRQAGTIRAENGGIKTGYPKDERARLQPALVFLRSHSDEVLRLLSEPPVETANPTGAERLAALEPTGQIAELHLLDRPHHQRRDTPTRMAPERWTER